MKVLDFSTKMSISLDPISADYANHVHICFRKTMVDVD